MLFNRIFSLLNITSLKGRIRFCFICFLILLICAVLFPLVIIGKQQRLKDATADIEKTINLQQTFINNWFAENMADIKSIAQLPVVQNKDYVKIKQSFNDFIHNNSKFDEIALINKDGITEINTSGSIGLNLSNRHFFKEAKNGNPFITDLIIETELNKSIIIVSVPIYDESNQFQGLVYGSIRIETIESMMSQLQDYAGETFIIDRKGLLITKSSQGKVGESIHTTVYYDALKGNRSKSFYKNNNGEGVLGNYRWVNDDRWLIVGEIKEKDIYKPFYRIISVFSIELVIIALIGYLLIVWFTNQIEKPIKNVLKGTRRVGLGEWGYRISGSNLDAKELRELSSNFNKMSDLIESHIDSIAKSEERFRMITEYSSDMISIHDSDGKYVYVSPAGKEILQYEDDELIGNDSFSYCHPDDIATIMENYRTFLTKGYVVSTYRIRRKDGEYIWLESSIKSLQDNDPKKRQFIAISRNITERKRVEQSLKEANEILHNLSTKDYLTNVWNRRTFDDQLQNEWHLALKESQPLSLIMFDVDYFKNFNDTYGHQAGDDCLKMLAATFSDIAKELRFMVFRYGGEEFAVILPNTNQIDAKSIAKKIQLAVNDLKIKNIGSHISDYVTMSFGVNTIVPKENDTITQFIKNTDKALYKAKADGRNCVRSFNDMNHR